MAYITTTELRTRLGDTLYARLTDRVDGVTPNSGVADDLVAEAEAVADSYLAVRYRTPVDLSAHPEVARVLAARVLDLAEVRAWRSSPFVSDPPQRIHNLEETALAWFQDAATGRLLLPAMSVLSGPVAVDDSARFAGGGRSFTADELDGL
jgi:phage gp36-like protein